MRVSVLPVHLYPSSLVRIRSPSRENDNNSMLTGVFICPIFTVHLKLYVMKRYYEIHVTGKESFSTSVVSDVELDDDDIIMLAYEQDKLEGDDCHYVDYIEELTFEEWNTHFNFNLKID